MFRVVGTELSNNIIGRKGRTFIFLCPNCPILTITWVDLNTGLARGRDTVCMRHSVYLPPDHTLNRMLKWNNSNFVKIKH